MALVLALVTNASGTPPQATGTHPHAAWSGARSGQVFASEVLGQAPLPKGTKLYKAKLSATVKKRFAGPGSAAAIAHRIYLVHQPATGPLLKYVLAHLPVGARAASSGWTSDHKGQTSEEFSVSLPVFGLHEYSAALSYVTTTVAGRGCLRPSQACLLLVAAETVWEPNRPATEVVPAGDRARVVLPAPGLVVVGGPKQPVSTSLALSAPASARLVKPFNALPLAPAVACTQDFPLYTIIFTPPPKKAGKLFKVEGWLCASQVSVIVAGRSLHTLYDPRQSFRATICKLVPKATREEICPPAPRRP
jgi:hypothetical protein